MNYIIDPMWFYWLSVVDTLIVVFGIFGGVSLLASIFSVVTIAANYEYGADDKDYKFGKKCLKIALPVLIISILLAVFIPSKETLIEIKIAQFATYENAEWTIDAIKSLVDYIVEAMKSV